MIDCPRGEIRDLLPDLLNDRLDEPARTEVESHVAGCAECSAELELLRDARAVMSRQAPALSHDRITTAVLAATRSTRTPVAPAAARPRRAPAWALPLAAAVLLMLTGVMAVVLRAPAGDDPAVRVAAGAQAEEEALVYAADAGLFVGGLADLDDAELESMLMLLPSLDPLPLEEPPALVNAVGATEG